MFCGGYMTLIEAANCGAINKCHFLCQAFKKSHYVESEKNCLPRFALLLKKNPQFYGKIFIFCNSQYLNFKAARNKSVNQTLIHLFKS